MIEFTGQLSGNYSGYILARQGEAEVSQPFSLNVLIHQITTSIQNTTDPDDLSQADSMVEVPMPIDSNS